MAYQANRNSSAGYDDSDQKARNDANNAKNIRNAADVAIASKNPYAAAVGGAVKAADKITGGKSTEALGKAMTKANKMTPGGQRIQDMSNRLSESGASDKIGTAASMKNGSGENTGEKVANVANSTSKDSKTSGDSKNDKDFEAKGDSSFSLSTPTKILLFLPFAGILFLAIFLATISSSMFLEYEDALGASDASGGQTGAIVYSASNGEAKEFYERINDVKLEMQSRGKSIDALKIVAVYHVLSRNDGSIDYESMTKDKIENIANAILNGNTYDEETFKENLANTIFAQYFPQASDEKRMQMAQDVINYIDGYYEFIGEENNACNSSGSCTYDIKGFYIHGKGNITKKLLITDLKVRLMQSGQGSGHDYGGTWGLPLEGEELVPFEKYILGVAYAEIGPSAPDEAIKAQMVAARSFALARPTDMGSWRTLQQENGQWVIQLANSTQDQVYCDPDQGCSSPNGQWSQVYSGSGRFSAYSNPALAEDHRMRVLAEQTKGEVLVNEQGNIIYAGYLSTESNLFVRLAKQGLNYKQILLNVYNSSRKYGATDVEKMSCNSANVCGYSLSSGAYSGWKQYEGPWINVPMGTSGKSIRQIGCLVTSISMLVAKSKAPTNIQGEFNPGTFVEYLNSHRGFSGGNLNWEAVTNAVPSFVFQNKISVLGYNKQQKLEKIKTLLSQGYYIVVEVKGNTGQHWVAIDGISGDTIIMMDPGSSSTDLWGQYDWRNTSTISYYKVV